MSRHIPLITVSQDFGQDKLTAVSLLGRHRDLQEKIQSIEPDVVRVGQVGEKLSSSNYSSEALYLAADPGRLEETEKLVPVEVWEDEPFERTEIQRVIEEVKVPQVRALYPYKDDGWEVKEGEMMFLRAKSRMGSPDWWNIKKTNGEIGYVPSNFVKKVKPGFGSKIVRES